MQQENHNGIKRFDSIRIRDAQMQNNQQKQQQKCVVFVLYYLYYYDYSNNSNTKVLLPKKEKEDVFCYLLFLGVFAVFIIIPMFCLSQVYL